MSKGIKVSSRKGKSRGLQQWVANKIAELTGFVAGKDCDIESRPMGQTGPDVRLSPSVLEYFPFTVECKRQETKSIPYKWIEQAKANLIPDTAWLLVVRRNREKAMVILDAEAFFDILDKSELFVVKKHPLRRTK